MNSYVFMIMAEFGPGMIPLQDCCEKYFGLSYDKAARKARAGELPVPCVRGGSQKSNWLVSPFDLAATCEQRMEEARRAMA